MAAKPFRRRTIVALHVGAFAAAVAVTIAADIAIAAFVVIAAVVAVVAFVTISAAVAVATVVAVRKARLRYPPL